MSSQSPPRGPSPLNNNDDYHLRRSPPPGPPSIISSRMTDIASEDGDEGEYQSGRPTQRRSLVTSESRPGTARTGASSRGNRAHPQPLRQNILSGLAAQRGSIGGGSVGGGNVAGSLGRTPSLTSRSHVPSLTSHAFFRPMSSQKLQAQRGGVPRPPQPPPPPPTKQPDSNRDSVGETGMLSALQQGDASQHQQKQPSDDGSFNAPPSLGTEMTGHDTVDRRTANTSPTGHHAHGSLSESMRPLQKKKFENPNLNVEVDRSYTDARAKSAALKTPRSFRSSFLLPGKSDTSHQNGSSRHMSGLQGAEKLSSGASSPRQYPSSPRHNHHLHQPDTPRKMSGGEHEAQPKPSRVGRVFEYFEGNTIFFFGGRWQNARQRPVNLATALLVALPAALFFAFSASYLWHEISPAIPITFAYLFYICFSSFIHASVSDPGILPRNLHRFPPAEDDDPLRLGPPTTDWYPVKSAVESTAAMEVPVKHCRTCNIWRPPRAHHCRLCDNCIETHDHHCVWVNNCVGRRNYRYFFAFVGSATLLAAYLIAASLAQILTYRAREGISFAAAIDRFRVPFAMVVYGALGMLYPLALMLYHVFLMARGETTREYINSHKFVKAERYRAFTQGNWVRNWIVVLCRPRPPTYYRFKGRYAAGDQRLAEQKGRRTVVADATRDMEMHNVKPSSAGSGFQGPAALRAEQRQQQQQQQQ